MNFFVEFYKGLDVINLVIFWGVIIVVLLLLIFAIIIARKNHRLERIIIENGIDLDEYDDDLAIKRQTTAEKEKEVVVEDHYHTETTNIVNNHTDEVKQETVVKEEPKEVVMPVIPNVPIHEEPRQVIIKEEPKQVIVREEPKEVFVTPKTVVEPVKEEKFVAEEHVMEYHQEAPKQPARAPYERNILRENANSTSPIGITVRHSNNEQEMAKARELHAVLKDDTLPPAEKQIPKKDPVSESHLLNQRTYADTYREPVRRGNYLDELSKKLGNTDDDINRTAYEIKQEEDAIISYQELMKRKDSIQTVDEEDAVISIDELIQRKKEQERIYNITKEEEDNTFIKELKDFRSDL